MANETDTDRTGGLNFLEQIVERDLRSGAVQQVVTRFPPEPNGYPHIGHAKAICINFGVAGDYEGRCHLRFDDTNPETEDMEFVHAMERDIRWLGFDWGSYQFHASDYFDQLFEHAIRLIEVGKAYVDSQTDVEIRENRGTVTEVGTDSRFRMRSVEENLALFRRMRAGEFPDGAHVLRAKIDMSSPNMLLRDPVIYRIKHAAHYRTGNEWPIYPLYDFAHPLSDAIEGITHSLCSLEFEVHRPLYDWLVDALYDAPRPHQYEFARLNLDYTVMSKRKLLKLVQGGQVNGWDDPRMPTLAGMRRRGITPESIRRFCDLIGVAKANNRVDIGVLEYAIRDDLNHKAPRVMAVVDPIKVTLANWPEGKIEWLEASYWPHDVPKVGTRPVPFGGTLYIDRQDFAQNPPPGFHRLSPGGEVRLRYAYVIRCDDVRLDDAGNVVELLCSYDPDTKSGGTSTRKVKGTIHWVEASQAVPAQFRLYDRLFKVPDPEDLPEGEDFTINLNPDSNVVTNGFVEHSVASAGPGDRFQFERQGFFCADDDSSPEHLVFNRTITLRDTWAKLTADPAPAAGNRAKEKAAQVYDGPPIPTLSAEQALAAKELAKRYGVTADDSAILASDPWLQQMFESTAGLSDPGLAANWVIHDVQRLRKTSEELALTPEALSAIIQMVSSEEVASRTAKELLAEVAISGEDPAALVEARGLRQIADSDLLESAVTKVIQANSGKVTAYREGKKGLIGFFMGQVMRETGGKANPEIVRSLLESALA
ncbi:MAG: glutaminyl-tRNA synthetase [Rhodothermales bacterium]|jgi:glutaminyl-tRNA synthetase